MTRSAVLECFDLDTRPRADAAPGPSQDWIDGHAAGLAQGRAEAEAALARRISAVTQGLSDAGFVYAEARADLLARLTPLFSALADRFLPTLRFDAARAHIVATLRDAAQRDLATPLQIEVAPDLVPAMREAATGIAGLSVNVQGNPDHGPGEVTFGIAGEETALDLDDFIETARDLLRAPLETPRSDKDDKRHA